MTAPWCPHSGRLLFEGRSAAAASRRVRCTHCGRRVPQIAGRLTRHRISAAHQGAQR